VTPLFRTTASKNKCTFNCQCHFNITASAKKDCEQYISNANKTKVGFTCCSLAGDWIINENFIQSKSSKA
jgi:hypothetical protein